MATTNLDASLRVFLRAGMSTQPLLAERDSVLVVLSFPAWGKDPKEKPRKIITISSSVKVIMIFFFFCKKPLSILLAEVRAFRDRGVMCHFCLARAITDQTTANQEHKETFCRAIMAGTAGGLSLL